jgi:alpha-tubulin suppressor-like RCC1 family protein
MTRSPISRCVAFVAVLVASAVQARAELPCGGGAECRFVQVSVGRFHALGLAPDGTVWAWGDNERGQLGVGGRSPSSVPARVRGLGGAGVLQDVVHVAAGEDHSLAVTSDGQVLAWGDDTQGQLGTGAWREREVPAAVAGLAGIGTLSGAVSVAAGDDISFAVMADGALMAWGTNRNGRLGVGSALGASGVPLAVTLPDPAARVMQVDVGLHHALAVTTDGRVYGWGANWWGLLGDGTRQERWSPVPTLDAGGTAPLSGIAGVAAGHGHSVAVTVGGDVLAWGYDGSGELGDAVSPPPSAPWRLLPVPVAAPSGSGTLGGVVAVVAGDTHSAALESTGQVLAWGQRTFGALGDGLVTPSVQDRPVFVQAPEGGPLTGVTALASGGLAVLALDASGLVSWGVNTWGLAADGTRHHQALPTCVRAPTGGTLPRFVQVSAGSTHVLALTEDGRVMAWGDNEFGQLGDGTTTSRSTPDFVKGVGGDRHP